jgi:hypothetical protein
MSLPTCQHCNKRKSTGFIRIKGWTTLWLCGTCFPMYDPDRVSTMFGEPGDGKLFGGEL